MVGAEQSWGQPERLVDNLKQPFIYKQTTTGIDQYQLLTFSTMAWLAFHRNIGDVYKRGLATVALGRLHRRVKQSHWNSWATGKIDHLLVKMMQLDSWNDSYLDDGRLVFPPSA
jgi:hypothetical protein